MPDLSPFFAPYVDASQDDGDASVKPRVASNVANYFGLEALDGGVVQRGVEVATASPPHGWSGPDLVREAPFCQVWLPSCGDINPGVMATPPTDGAPLSLHSVSRRALCTAGDGSTRTLHLPPGGVSGGFRCRPCN